MEWVTDLDGRLSELVVAAGPWAYMVVASLIAVQAVIFVGWAVPGNGLVFAAGLLAAAGGLRVLPLYALSLLLTVAAAMLCYAAGYWLGKRVLSRAGGLLNAGRLAKVQGFFDRYGARTMAVVPFVPFARSVAPVVAGVGRMNVWLFAVWTTAGFGVWIAVLLAAGAWLGEVAWIRDNLGWGLLVVGAAMAAKLAMDVSRSRRRARSQVL
jgi:membrane-associated protein